jgi:hypothetical protein
VQPQLGCALVFCLVERAVRLLHHLLGRV